MSESLTIHYDPQLHKLTVRNAEEFPQEVFEYADEVEILDMSQGKLTTLPKEIEQFKNLRIGFFSYNQFESVPETLSLCPRLELVGFKACKIRTLPDNALPKTIKGIILTDNKLEHLPESIGEYHELKKVMLTGNRLTQLPESMIQLQKLELLRVAVNELQNFPDWLGELPALGWYADAGNPLHMQKNDSSAMPEVDWSEIILGAKVGESPSSEVFAATLHNKHVAVKLYRSHITTDGLAIDDMYACLQAGNHARLIGGIAKIKNIPDDAYGLVMPLIADTYTKLAGPPDFVSFTRDSFQSGIKFSLPVIINILTDIASALTYLHAKGVMHGDIYAHNILTAADGHSYLGDFGAASSYKQGTKEAKIRQALDVRGYGCLIEDLLLHAETGELEDNQLVSLKEACLNTNVNNRPSFHEISESLSGFF